MTPATSVWSPWRFNLGDHWATINYLITRSWMLKEEIHLSRRQHGQDFQKRFLEIISCLSIPKSVGLTLVHEPGTHEPEGEDVWTCPFWPTKHQWMPNGRKVIAYQFDGISSSADKNPSPADEDKILAAIGARGYDPVRLGNHLTLWECMLIAAQARCFVGCDSGMSHLCHSVGVPMYLVEYKLPIITTHRYKQYVHCRGTEDLIWSLEKDLA